MTSLRSFQCDLGGFEISHFADEDYFWRLTQGGAQGRGKVARVVPNLSLIDGRPFVQVKVFDWIFDRNNMVVLLLVDDVDYGRLSRTLTGTGWTSYQYQAIPKLRNLVQWLRQTQRLQGGNVSRDHPHDDGVDTSLLEYIDAKA